MSSEAEVKMPAPSPEREAAVNTPPPASAPCPKPSSGRKKKPRSSKDVAINPGKPAEVKASVLETATTPPPPSPKPSSSGRKKKPKSSNKESSPDEKSPVVNSETNHEHEAITPGKVTEVKASVLETATTPPPASPKPSSSGRKKKPRSSKESSPDEKGPVVHSETNDEHVAIEPGKSAKKTMTEMVHEAIKALKDRKGSSQIAIQKYILAVWAQDDNPTFRSRLLQTLKRGVKSQRFVKIRASYKISSEWTKKEKARKSRDAARKSAERKKRDQSLQKKRNEAEAKRFEEMSDKLSKEELAKLKQKHEEKLERQRQKEEAARKAKERAERLKKRRFPMEDTKLHAEDKELGVQPPKSVKRRPALPYFFQLARDSKTTAATPSRCDAMDHDRRGLVPDLLQVYHFFRGDVRFSDLTEKKMMCDFSLVHLIYAVDEVLMGNARKSRMVPPLLTHLFCVCLSILTSPISDTGESNEQAQLHKDLRELSSALNPASWPEVCIMYMECMDRYYRSPASQDPSVLTPGVTDVSYLFRVTQTPDLTPPQEDIPEGYYGYFGHRKSILAKAFDKLNRQNAWNLHAEELLALLRALTDDVLATRPDIMIEISEREERLYELAKAKRLADSNFRKVKLGFEGPPAKKPVPQKKKDGKKDDATGKVEDKKDENQEPNSKEKPWKQTATKRQLEQAKREQKNAHQAYEEGLKTLMARSEPFGFDRHFNRYYCFLHEPEYIFVEMNRSTTANADHLPEEVQVHRTSWHAIDKMSLLDQFATSLDVRGHREKALHETLLGTEDTPALKRFLYDDVKDKNAIEARKQERDELQKQLEEIRLNNLRVEEEAGRRPTRFLLEQVTQLESQIVELDKKIAAAETPYIPDYARLTGLDVLKKFGTKTRRSIRQMTSDGAVPVPCTNLIPNGSSGSGLVGCIVDEMLNVERLCQDLVPWEEEEKRNLWISDLETLARSWNDACPQVLGPDVKEIPDVPSPALAKVGTSRTSPEGRQSLDSSTPPNKRRRLDSPVSVASPSSQMSLYQINSQLKQPLLDLEERIYQVSGLAMADRDQIIADDNMSAAEEEEETTEEDLERERHKKLVAWRKKIHQMRSIPATRASQVRETVVQAMAAARKANLGNVVAKLRSVLLLYHADAAGECKQAAIALLGELGGYDPDDEDDDDEEEEEEGKSEEDKDDEEPVASNLCFEAMSLNGSLGDDDNATRLHWTEAVRQCTSISRFAALSTAFCHKATEILEKKVHERGALEKALEKWHREEERKKRSTSTTKKNIHKVVAEAPTEMWANVKYTEEFCMVHLENHPWWPAKKCIAKDVSLRTDLTSFDRVLVAMVGEYGELRCVKSDDIRTFTGSPLDDESLEPFSKEDRSQLEETLAIARRIIRGHRKSDASAKVQEVEYAEEKKTAS